MTPRHPCEPEQDQVWWRARDFENSSPQARFTREWGASPPSFAASQMSGKGRHAIVEVWRGF